jgi:hypothetical protein
MPENVTGFQPIENLKKSLINLAYFDMPPSRSPTFFPEEPLFHGVPPTLSHKATPCASALGRGA